MKIASHAWLELPFGKICLSFKIMKNVKIVDPVLTINSFYDQDHVLQKEVKIPLRK